MVVILLKVLEKFDGFKSNVRLIISKILKKTYVGDTVYCANHAVISHSFLEGANKIGINSNVVYSKVGYGTYCGRDVVLDRCCIGRFCSIANNVRMIIGKHPSKIWVTTHPSFFSTQRQCGVSYVSEDRFDELDSNKEYLINIGNDVWLGYGTLVLGG